MFLLPILSQTQFTEENTDILWSSISPTFSWLLGMHWKLLAWKKLIATSNDSSGLTYSTCQEYLKSMQILGLHDYGSSTNTTDLKKVGGREYSEKPRFCTMNALPSAWASASPCTGLKLQPLSLSEVLKRPPPLNVFLSSLDQTFT